MTHRCDGSPDSLNIRLGNRSSDDSLILDDNNTGGMWADSENEPATFQVLLKQHSSSFSERPINSVNSHDGGFRKPWAGHASKTAAISETSSQNVYSMLMQDRLSLSGEESEAPLLSSEGWTSGGFLEDNRHCHAPSDLSHNNSTWRRLMSATVLCLFFMIAEFFGGYFAGSGAIMSDAAHLLSDLVGLLISLSAVWLRKRPPTKTLSFGFYRAEVLGALFSVFVIWVLTGIFVYIAILRVIHRDFDIRPDRMMAVAAGGIVINVIMGLVLHGGCQLVPHSHGFGLHGHSHGNSENNDDVNGRIPPCQHRLNENLENLPLTLETDDVMSKQSNINVRAAVIHVLGDLIQSIGVLIAAIVIKFNPEAKIADPICTFLFAIVVLATTIPLVRDIGIILLEGFPRTIGYSQVSSTLSDIPGVQHVHSLHVWSLTAGKHALAVHLAIDSATNRDLITARAQYLLQTKFGIDFCTIQTESFDHSTMNSCFQCKPPVN